jgi:hypothetical protein
MAMVAAIATSFGLRRLEEDRLTVPRPLREILDAHYSARSWCVQNFAPSTLCPAGISPGSVLPRSTQSGTCVYGRLQAVI